VANLSSQKSVRAAAAELISWSDVPVVNIVVNSAGIMLIPERTLSEEGIELQFATNHIGHFLFTNLIMPKLIKAAEGSPKGATRIVNVSSGSPMGATMRWSDMWVTPGVPYFPYWSFWRDTRHGTRIKESFIVWPVALFVIYIGGRTWTRRRSSSRCSDYAYANFRFRSNFEKVNKDLPQDEQPNYAFHSAWGVTDTENKSYIPLEGYNQSKVANVLFGVGANKRLYEKYGILSLGLHPGVIKTELGRSAVPETLTAIDAMAKSGVFTYKTLGAGAATSLVAALDPKLGVGGTKNGKENYGAFLADCQISDQARAESTSSAEAEKLWKLSEKLVNDTFAW